MRTCHRIALAMVCSSLPLAAQARPNGQHDFDFEIGRWRTHLQRLAKPLSHSTTWITYDGTSVVRAVWGGLANLGELEVDGGGAPFTICSVGAEPVRLPNRHGPQSDEDALT